MEWLNAFRAANIPNATEWHSENTDGTCLDLSVYLNKWEFISITDINPGEYMVYINNPNSPRGQEPELGQEEQWIFGYYKSFKRAVNKCLAIAKKGKYPQPIEKW